ncbi:16S rRNA (cytidine1402-2'-O)-methyltransferase [Zhihengliuella halotolerans]|uniref:Ribosomal RNA small subunit methyltransferase I n=1 Tax=Zhihengliuella halotolerans TaxID=370736 RepID=A0A4Q8ACY1_9MICC|nr:16S rRNA (cytidine1402-2'-O)-methyltransferase [Zhihengliuella halotolerans]
MAQRSSEETPENSSTPTAPGGGALAELVPGSGTIVLAATPIGNLSDASPRLIELMRTAHVVAAEDTRRLLHLANALGVRIPGRIVSYHEHNEASRIAELLETVQAGATLLVVSDAGMPAVSDPGFRLVEAAVAADVAVTAVPGPSAVLTALSLSGLPTDRFTFEGFLPRKTGDRAARLADLADERRTMVFFEAPHRLAAMLRALAEAFGSSRQAAVARELTKMHEEVRRGPLDALVVWAEEGVRGEIAVVVSGKTEADAEDDVDHVAAVQAMMDSGVRLKDAVAAVAERDRISKRELYAAVVAARQ